MERHIYLTTFLGVCVLCSGAEAQSVEYRFKPNESYVYSVRVETEEGGATESLAGTVVYTALPGEMGRLKVSARGVMYPQQRAANGKPLVPTGAFRILRFWPGAAGSPLSAPNTSTEAEVGSQGVPTPMEGKPALRGLGELAGLIVEPLSKDGSSTWTWEAEGPVHVMVTELLAPYARVARTRASQIPAKEKVTYSVGRGTSGLLSVQKKYELKAQDPAEAQPRFEITGDGKIAFDARAGVPKWMDFKGTLTDRSDNPFGVRVPLTVTYKLLEGQEAARALNPPKISGLQQATASDVTRLLADVSSGDGNRRKSALDRLAQTAPNEKRDLVALTIEPILGDPDLFTRAAAAKALGPWCSPLTLRSLERAASDPEHAVRWATLDALGVLGDPNAADTAAARLPQDTMWASNALKKMGPEAASTVVKMLRHPDWRIRNEACKILEVIGTKSSAAQALQAMARDQNGIVAMSARSALRAVSARP